MDCYVEKSGRDWDASGKTAIEAWNRRASLSQPIAGEVVEANAVMRVVHDLESWRAVERNFDNRKLLDDATTKLRAALSLHDASKATTHNQESVT
jgi:hypothetical protein